ncbi:secondary thiamine-phosphate synthase enzyme YjbQ [Halostagnicola kamekurae]|uniref:Secondary thiamine-phosphate synthase enzyme n=1 Tax=Halostagnicola kamekurae TaxID=619731 RepID=A0A1I6SMM4_9EURY|nr:secondary thiamine-phosphate synthase enzyme YjbQ [Halostagnicola kamekurae]SFS78193.1 secondary thiamine-phosphate synthase enzyme [Halostagnicola kamekurae]
MEFTVETDQRLTTVDLTDRVRDAVPSDIDRGLCTVFVAHTTAAVLLQEDEDRLRTDLEDFFAGVVPDEGHAHDRLDGNADSHLRASVVGPSVTIPVENGSLAMGTWQSVLLAEFDGPRTRTVSVTTVRDGAE